MDYENEEDDFLEQAQRRAKRNFLHEEILEAGFSGTLFTAFCEQERGSDIDLWTFEELQDCVRRFKAKVVAEELQEPAKTEVEKEEGAQPPIVERKREFSPTAVDASVKPKLVEAESSPLDSPKTEQRVSPKQQTKAYRSPPSEIPPVAAATKDPPKPAIIIPPLAVTPVKPVVIIPQKKEESPKLLPVSQKKEESPKLSALEKLTVVVPEPLVAVRPAEPSAVEVDPEVTDGPASLLPATEYTVSGHSLQSTELSDSSGKLKVSIEK